MFLGFDVSEYDKIEKDNRLIKKMANKESVERKGTSTKFKIANDVFVVLDGWDFCKLCPESFYRLLRAAADYFDELSTNDRISLC